MTGVTALAIDLSVRLRGDDRPVLLLLGAAYVYKVFGRIRRYKRLAERG